jgi:hypothetical protein
VPCLFHEHSLRMEFPQGAKELVLWKHTQARTFHLVGSRTQFTCPAHLLFQSCLFWNIPHPACNEWTPRPKSTAKPNFRLYHTPRQTSPNLIWLKPKTAKSHLTSPWLGGLAPQVKEPRLLSERGILTQALDVTGGQECALKACVTHICPPATVIMGVCSTAKCYFGMTEPQS